MSETISRLGRPKVTMPSPRIISVRPTPSNPAPRRAISAGMLGGGFGSGSRFQLHLAADDGAAELTACATDGEHVAGDGGAGMHDHVAVERDHVAFDAAVHLGVPLEHHHVRR